MFQYENCAQHMTSQCRLSEIEVLGCSEHFVLIQHKRNIGGPNIVPKNLYALVIKERTYIVVEVH